MTTFQRLYCIVDHDVASRSGWTCTDLARAYLDGGARVLQIRAKSVASGDLLELCERLGEMAHAADGVVIVNDRADLARLARADGVHVGQDDLPAGAARAIVGGDAIVGLSTHSEAQVRSAAGLPISYLAVGPVYPTGTKATGYDEVGLGLVRFAAASALESVGEGADCPLPVVAIGGITLERASEVIQAGATAVAVISDLLSTGDPAARVREFLRRLAV